MTTLKSDCIFFPGDKPCKPHKENGVTCENCNLYKPIGQKILIIKLDALGDVLRTTSILHALEEKYHDSSITWFTRENARDLFIGNDFVDEVLFYEDVNSTMRLGIEEYDVVINLDPSTNSAAIASLAKGKFKFGFGLKPNGKVYPFNKESEEWFKMGAFDNLKKQNKKSYQQIIHEICKLPYSKGEIIIKLTGEEINFKNDFTKEKELNKFDFIIGINAGASNRWQFKKWKLESYAELVDMLIKKFNCGILLFGGKDEVEVNSVLMNVSKNVINTGEYNSLREFFSLVDISDIFITGDTLALHVATALKKSVVCMFGPTSYTEIEDYNRITRVIPDLDCLVCYKNTCDIRPNCMEMISAEMVYNSVVDNLQKLGKI
ncbi:MAG: glycosyltransferase family 9 protein [Ignavibacteria bacterium]|nr:glycosyltransferase family 9 protein [Ignavibacteria bacterium]